MVHSSPDLIEITVWRVMPTAKAVQLKSIGRSSGHPSVFGPMDSGWLGTNREQKNLGF
jgi:hypothetical protein